MVEAEAQILRTAAAACETALRIPDQLRRIGAHKERIADAEENSENAGNILRMAIERWLRTL